jgi:hypothetical protein
MAATPLTQTENPPLEMGASRPFDFSSETFSYVNELVWEYFFDTKTGQGTAQKRNPPPTYAHHCFVVVRSARQFFLHAVFEPNLAPVEDHEYAVLIRAVVARSPQAPSSNGQRISIPGFANLRRFSEAHADLLRQNCGGAWQSYAQRGNWRMVLPFSRSHQATMAEGWRHAVAARRYPIVHVVTFPRLTINHAVLLLAAEISAARIEFQAYDPNICEHPLLVSYDRRARRFEFPRTHYCAGGRVKAYEIYCGRFL